MLGGWLALLAAATFAFSNVSARRAVIDGTVLQGLFVTVPIGLIFSLMVTLISGLGDLLSRFTLLQVLFFALLRLPVHPGSWFQFSGAGSRP